MDILQFPYTEDALNGVKARLEISWVQRYYWWKRAHPMWRPLELRQPVASGRDESHEDADTLIGSAGAASGGSTVEDARKEGMQVEAEDAPLEQPPVVKQLTEAEWDAMPPFPLEVEHLFFDTLSALRPKLSLASSFVEAHAAVVKLELDMQKKIGLSTKPRSSFPHSSFPISHSFIFLLSENFSFLQQLLPILAFS